MCEYQSIAEFLEDHEDEIVVEALKRYYKLLSIPNKIDIEPDQEILDAVALVLKDFMAPSEYLKWVNSIATKEEQE